MLGVGAGLLGLGTLNYLGGRSQAKAINEANARQAEEDRRAAAVREKLAMGGSTSGLGDVMGRWDEASGTFKDTLTPGTKDLMTAQRDRATTGEQAGTMGNRAAMGPGGFQDFQLTSLPSMRRDAQARAETDRRLTREAFVDPAVNKLMAQMQRTRGGTSNQAPAVYEGMQPLMAQLDLPLEPRTDEYMRDALAREQAKIGNINALINQGSFDPSGDIVTAGQRGNIANIAGKPINTQRPDAGAGLAASSLADVIAAGMANTRREQALAQSKQQTDALIAALANRGLGNQVNRR